MKEEEVLRVLELELQEQNESSGVPCDLKMWLKMELRKTECAFAFDFGSEIVLELMPHEWASRALS